MFVHFFMHVVKQNIFFTDTCSICDFTFKILKEGQVEYLKCHDTKAVALMDDTTTKGIAPDHALFYLFIFYFSYMEMC